MDHMATAEWDEENESGKLQAICVGRHNIWRVMPDDLFLFLARWNKRGRRNTA